jgi:hypothetical protein
MAVDHRDNLLVFDHLGRAQNPEAVMGLMAVPWAAAAYCIAWQCHIVQLTSYPRL